MVEEKFIKALKMAGITEISTSYDRYGHFYTVIKNLHSDEFAKKFIEQTEKLGFRGKASLFKGSDTIWVFKAYN